jgi:cell division protein ZipA
VMELTVRDWMVVVGVLLILAVILDAVRRMRSDKYSRGKAEDAPEELDAEAGAEIDENELFWPRELPNGRARVVDRSDQLKAKAVAEEKQAEQVEQRAASQVSDAEEALLEPEPESEPLVSGFSALAEDENDNPSENLEVQSVSGETVDWLDAIDSDIDEPGAADQVDETSAAGALPRGIEPEVFMMNVVSRSPAGFNGEDILHILLACDLRFGDLNFFHRHEHEAGRGPIQFSVANMMQPGVFDIDNMGEFNTPGLVFFVTLPGPEDMMKAFDYMLETAEAVARNLDGDVLDESRSAITRQTLDHSRQMIRDLERRMLARTASKA